MTWWGNSFDKAYGLSNIASNALKKAQKKIDKVLDIPTEEDFNINKAIQLSDNNEKEYENVENEVINIDNQNSKMEFSDISLKSPNMKLSDKNELDFDIYDQTTRESNRLGDWKTEDSLTASQFDNCCQSIILKQKLAENDVTTESSKVNFQLSQISDDENLNELNFIGRLDESTPVPIIDPISNIDKENHNLVESNRYSHLSISSDCTTSTVKRVCSDMESSDHTDDFTSINDMGKSDSSFINDEDNEKIDDVIKCNSSHSTTEEKTLTVDVATTKIGFINHSISINSPGSKDDVDSNTTSSDIEPLSCATSNNGDNNQSSIVNHHTMSRYFIPTEYMKHQRSASGSSMSICKIDNFDDSNDSDHFTSHHNYQIQIDELSKKLDIRESKMIQLSRENIDLRDTINNLTRQIEQINERQETDTTDINSLTREFTNRLSDAEKRYQLANKERDQLKKYFTEIKNTESQQIERVIKEKEEQVASLLQEGEKLAQDQLKASNTIKKLRTSLKDYESEINAQNSKVVKFESEIIHLKKVLDSHEENERKHIDGINQLTKAVEKLEKENAQINNAKEILQDRNRTLETVLDKSNHELTKLKKQIIELDSARMSIENNHKSLINQQANKTDIIEEINIKLEQSEKEISLLQKKIQTQSREFSYKEDDYNSRISYLQDRVAEMEQRQEELSEGASVATRPILRQLEAFQNNCSIHTANWERNELNLNMKLNDLQQKLTIAEEVAQTYKEQLKSRDFLANSLREEKNKLLSQYNNEYISKQSIIDEKIILEQKIIEIEKSFQDKISERNREIQNMEYKLSDIQNKLEMEKQNANTLSAKLTNMQIMLDNKQDKKYYRSRNSSGISGVTEVEPNDSISIISNKSLENTDRKSYFVSPLYEQLRQQGVAVMMEHLEASLKQKEGQINKLHRELDNMSRSRDSMIEEMIALTQTIEKLELKLESQQSMIDDINGLNGRYNELLQLYGEKLEECQELQMDISELKEVYRSHIDMLSKTNEFL